jgi:AraC-like DNA-binding protein/mannose-6-phosphate isomerase-like protein (cupin superfamily)
MPRRSAASAHKSFPDLNGIEVSIPLGSVVADVFQWAAIDPKPWRNYLHAHSFYEVCYAFSGKGTFTINGQSHSVRKGQVFVAKPNEPHEIIANNRSPLGIYFWSYTLVPTKTKAYTSDPATEALMTSFIATRTAPAGPAAHMEATIAMLADEIAQQWAGCIGNIEALTRKLLLDTARVVVPEGTRATLLPAVPLAENDRIVRTAITYLRDNLARPIGVRDVAVQVQLSERHLERLFNRATGQTVLQHLTTARLTAAAQQLLDHDLPIKQIAAGVGYEDVRYFTTLFRTHMNATPARFRASGGTKHFTDKRHQ